MDRKFTIEARKLRNVVLFNPEVGPDDNSNTESSIFIKVSDKKLVFEILSFRYLLIGKEDVDSNEGFEMVLPLKRLQDIVKSFADDVKITFKEEKENLVSLEVGGIKFKMKTCEQEGRNHIGDDRGEEYKINRDDLLESIKKVKIAMGDDEVRYYLNGINIEIYSDENSKCHTFTVATNGHILATSGEKKEEYKLLQKAIMPKKVIPDIMKILEKGENEVLVSFSKGKMDIKTKNLEILLKLVDGEFPDYEKVIPYNNSKEIKINVDILKDVLGKVSIVSNDKTKNVKISIKSESIDLEMVSSDGSMARGDIKTNYTGDEINTVLNAKYLLDILGQINGESFSFKMEDGASPILIQQENNKGLLFVLMPIRS
jgi:DNA polymerase III subunit beta